ncbi:MAG: sodium:proton antiporter [Eubacteriales Family XIII. Incertae Sedis bacterium]|nr:MAG: sodium:proton antiporter [Clostridiales Family XIII bacterium]
MAHIDPFILDLALVLVTAGIATIIFRKIKQPVVLGYIVAGFLVSPNFLLLPTVSDIANIEVWASIGIIFLMFALGLEFSFHNIAKVGGGAIITALVVMGSMTVVGYGLGSLLGWGKMDSIFLGCMLAISSTMIILKAYEELGIKSEPFAQLTLGALVIEDIVGIFMLIILTAISASKEVSGIELVGEIGMMLLVLIIILCVGIYIVPTLLNKVKDTVNDEILMIASIGFCLLMVVISIKAGFSEALGAFLAGSILAGTSFGERIEHLVKPLKDLFGAIFFVSVGMLIEPTMLVKYAFPILIITIVTIVGQMTFSFIGALASGQPFERAVRIGFSMVQVGEFSFIIASLGASLGVTGDFLYPIIVCVSVITTFTTPIFIKNGEKAAKKLYLKLPNKLRVFLLNYTSDKQDEVEKDNDWAKYMKKYFIKLLLGTAILLGIYLLSVNYVHPYLTDLMVSGTAANVLTLVVGLIMMTPVINMICTKKSMLFNKIWLKSKANILPLLTLRAISVSVSSLFIIMMMEKLLLIPLIFEVIVAIAVVLFSVKSGLVRGRSAQLQTTFLANFNQKILNNAKAASGGDSAIWVDEILYVCRFRLTKIYKRKKIKDFVASRVFGVMLIQIVHKDGRLVLIPRANDKTEEGDIIYAMGTREQIDAYMMFLEKIDYAEIENNRVTTLKEFLAIQKSQGILPDNMLLCAAIPIDRDSEFARKSIEDSGFTENYEGIILGVERNLLPVVSPNKDFVILENDIMWTLGAQNMLDAMVRAGLLEE